MQAPLIIYGTVTESGSGVNAVTVKARNESSNETITADTNSSGQYVLDASGFTNGYSDGDQITVYTIYSNFEGQETLTIALPTSLYVQNIALSAVSDSGEIDYCTVQDVYDELDGKTSTDISTDNIIKAVQRAEGLIDLRTDTSFKVNTVTQEIFALNRYSTEVSPEMLDIHQPFPQRTDRWGYTQNMVHLNNTPVISITTLEKNTAGPSAADSWTELDQQSGSGGDYILMNSDTGRVDFVSNYPTLGERSLRLTYTWGHDPDSTDRRILARIRVVQRLTILLAAKTVLSRKSSGSVFDSARDIKIGTIEIRGAGTSTSKHVSDMKVEEDELWNALGDLGVEII